MSSEMREYVAALREREHRFHGMGGHYVAEVIRGELEDILARTEAGADGAEVLRLRHLLADTEEQVRVLTEMVERGQAHHERMMKLMDPQDASGDADVISDAARYWASGPDGMFFTDNAGYAELLIRNCGYDRDDWTITDLEEAQRNAMQAKEAK